MGTSRLCGGKRGMGAAVLRSENRRGRQRQGPAGEGASLVICRLVGDPVKLTSRSYSKNDESSVEFCVQGRKKITVYPGFTSLGEQYHATGGSGGVGSFWSAITLVAHLAMPGSHQSGLWRRNAHTHVCTLAPSSRMEVRHRPVSAPTCSLAHPWGSSHPHCCRCCTPISAFHHRKLTTPSLPSHQRSGRPKLVGSHMQTRLLGVHAELTTSSRRVQHDTLPQRALSRSRSRRTAGGCRCHRRPCRRERPHAGES